MHAQDIRQPLGLARTPSVDALTPVADFFARRDFTVPSRTRVAGLQLQADDGPLATGTGPLVTGSTLALVMSMAGRMPYVAKLDGPGVPTLRTRLHESARSTRPAVARHPGHRRTWWPAACSTSHASSSRPAGTRTRSPS